MTGPKGGRIRGSPLYSTNPPLKWGHPSNQDTLCDPPTGCVLLDVGGGSFPAIVDEIVVSLVKDGHLPSTCANQLETLLLRKHKHHGNSSDTTLWDRIKSSAADGALHQIGEGLRRKGSSASVLGTNGGGGGGGSRLEAGEHCIPAVTLDKRATLSDFPLLQEESSDNNEVMQ